MGMYDAIKNFNKQFEYEPRVENAENLKTHEIFIVAGMGGSHLAADILQTWNPMLPLFVYSDYAPIALAKSVTKNSLVIVNSYSGNTEETLDVFTKSIKAKIPIAAISTGGKLLELAKEYSIPYIQIPDTGIQPRMALGFTDKALLRLMGQEEALKELGKLSTSLDAAEYKNSGKMLAENISGKIPVVYSSTRNRAVAYNWKAKFNETGKIPAFYNVFPELNHNEMTGFDVKDATRELSSNFYFILLRDGEDDPRIQKRMETLKKLFEDRGLPVEIFNLEGETKFYKIFSSLILADWAAYYTAEKYGLDAEQVPMVEEFKKLIM